MSNKTQDLINHSKTMPELIKEANEVDSSLVETYGDDAPVLIMQCALGALADQLEKAGLLDKKEWLLESISRRRELLKG